MVILKTMLVFTFVEFFLFYDQTPSFYDILICFYERNLPGYKRIFAIIFSRVYSFPSIVSLPIEKKIKKKKSTFCLLFRKIYLNRDNIVVSSLLLVD